MSSLILYTWFGIIPLASIFNISLFSSLIIKPISIGNGKLFLIFRFTKPESTKTDLKLSKLLNEYSPPFWVLCIEGKIKDELSGINLTKFKEDILSDKSLRVIFLSSLSKLLILIFLVNIFLDPEYSNLSSDIIFSDFKKKEFWSSNKTFKIFVESSSPTVGSILFIISINFISPEANGNLYSGWICEVSISNKSKSSSKHEINKKKDNG